MHTPPAEDELTLYCLAHAGGSAAPYRLWGSLVPAGCRVVPLELPGHGARLREPLAPDLDALAAELTGLIGRDGARRFAVFGHSFGSLLAFELSRRLTRLGTPPAALLVAGRNCPAGPLSHEPLHGLPDERLLTELGRYGGIPAELRDEPELLRVYLPAIRHDLRLTETYTRSPGPALGVPVAAWAGRRDRLVELPHVFGWAHETTAGFELSVLASGHFLLDEPEFRAGFTARLERLVRPPGPAPYTPPARAPAPPVLR
ncbi:thioesterase [Streptomyces armeniacus]|uniref:Thioesterase n=1 Tax=Streptomyces armeniacus TaxID=83291 RepID=A0A345XJL2_9ACTN|nr:alpha/beta fold hydrolase [Streptomyces armeniacus]AXK31828.1 thioesterase [Streptomyces armeniacus]